MAALHELVTPTAWVQIDAAPPIDRTRRLNLTAVNARSPLAPPYVPPSAELSEGDVRSLRDTLSKWLDGNAAVRSEITARPRARRRRRT